MVRFRETFFTPPRARWGLLCKLVGAQSKQRTSAIKNNHLKSSKYSFVLSSLHLFFFEIFSVQREVHLQENSCLFLEHNKEYMQTNELLG